MAENTYKLGVDSKRRGSVFAWIERQLNMDTAFIDGLPVKYIPHVLFCTLLGVFYVGNTHYAESTQREINKLESEVEDMRADYTTLKADYMHAKLQSEVAERVKLLGLEESETPPYKIILEKE